MDDRRKLMLAGGISANPILEENDWETISKMARSGKASEYWKIGDTKTITCNGNAMTVQIIGFDHDNVTDSATYGRSKAGITFQTVECYPATYKMINGSASVWSNSYARTDRMRYFLNGLGDIQNYIVPVNKLAASSVGTSTSVGTTSDSLFLLSTSEIGISSEYSRSEGSQYAYYAAGNSKIKTLSGTATQWWHRTPAYSSSYLGYFNTTSKKGGISLANGDYSSHAYAFAFCV